jgi:hypothetical protein
MADAAATLSTDGLSFYSALPVFSSFARLTDASVYAPLPDGWLLGLADIVESTEAIATGGYKAVNTAAAAVIVAMANALKDRDFPFIFGGDGASFAVPSEHEALARQALADMAAWVRDEFRLELRVALMRVSEIRADGYDVKVARFAPSPDISYAMFTGGGLAHADARLKAGIDAIPPGPKGAIPDLSGLTCRFDDIKAENGLILSLIVTPVQGADQAAFDMLVSDVLNLIENSPEAGRPVPQGGPTVRWPPAGFEYEVRSQRGSPLIRRLRLLAGSLGSYLVFRTGLRVGSFDPVRYTRQLVENTDFRKFDDGLRMTLDCTPALADQIDARLRQAERDGIAKCGTHRQTSALMTCFVPYPSRGDHIHFVDGAMGGYAAAAQALKSGA